MLDNLVIVFFIIAMSLFVCWLLMNKEGVENNQRIDQNIMEINPIGSLPAEVNWWEGPWWDVKYLGGPEQLLHTKP